MTMQDDQDLEKTSSQNQFEEKPKRGRPASPQDLPLANESETIEVAALRDVLEGADELTENEKEAIRSRIIEKNRAAFAQKVADLEAEYTKQSAYLSALKERGANEGDIKEQARIVKKCYDAYRNFKIDKSLEVPDALFELLELDDCLKIQKLWLLNYCYNGGNPVDACDKTNVSMRHYRKWLEKDSRDAICFQEAIKDIDRAYLDIAEQNLKKMAASNNINAIVFFLRSKHDDYKPTSKKIADLNKKRTGTVHDYTSRSKEEKMGEFLSTLGVIKTSKTGLDEVEEL